MTLIQKILPSTLKSEEFTKKISARKNNYLFFSILFCIVLSTHTLTSNKSFAKDSTDSHLFSHDSQADVSFSSNQAKKQKNTYELSGDVVLTQDNTTLKSDKAFLYYIKSDAGSMKLDHATAKGNVTISKRLATENSELRASCTEVILYPDKNLLVLTGNAKVWRNDEFIHAKLIKINTITGDLDFNVPRGQFATKKDQ